MCGILTDIHKEGRIIWSRVESVFMYEYIVEPLIPHPPVGSQELNSVEICKGDRFFNIIFKLFGKFLICQIDEFL
jgi:hypothetical protein